MIRDDIYSALEACDQEEPFEYWPPDDIRVGMLIQVTPGHKHYFKRANQTGIVTQCIKDRADVLWSDGYLERDIRPYSLEKAQGPDTRVNQAFKQVIQEDWMYEEDTNLGGYAKRSASPGGFQVGDLVSPGHGLDAFHDYQGAGLVVEVDDCTVPGELLVLWPQGEVFMMEDDLVPYDE